MWYSARPQSPIILTGPSPRRLPERGFRPWPGPRHAAGGSRICSSPFLIPRANPIRPRLRCAARLTERLGACQSGTTNRVFRDGVVRQHGVGMEEVDRFIGPIEAVLQPAYAHSGLTQQRQVHRHFDAEFRGVELQIQRLQGRHRFFQGFFGVLVALEERRDPPKFT